MEMDKGVNRIKDTTYIIDTSKSLDDINAALKKWVLKNTDLLMIKISFHKSEG